MKRTYQPSKIKRVRKHGFRKRMKKKLFGNCCSSNQRSLKTHGLKKV